MKRNLGPVVAITSLVLAGSAFASSRCHVPLADWQPREALQEKVRALGWTVIRIKTDDGCYKIYGTDESGQRVKAKFNPATLERMKHDHDD